MAVKRMFVMRNTNVIQSAILSSCLSLSGLWQISCAKNNIVFSNPNLDSWEIFLLLSFLFLRTVDFWRSVFFMQYRGVVQFGRTAVSKTARWRFESFHPCQYGEVSEWLKELVLKTSDGKTSVGSNPTLTAIWRGRIAGRVQRFAKPPNSCFCSEGSNPSLSANMLMWWNWHTCQSKKLVVARPCEFKSRHEHQHRWDYFVCAIYT